MCQNVNQLISVELLSCEVNNVQINELNLK